VENSKYSFKNNTSIHLIRKQN